MFPIQNLDFSFISIFFCGLITILLTLLNFQISDENKNSVPLRFFGGNIPVITCDSVRNIFYAGIHLWWTNLNTISRLPIILIVVKAVYSHPIYIWWLPNNGPGATEPPRTIVWHQNTHQHRTGFLAPVICPSASQWSLYKWHTSPLLTAGPRCSTFYIHHLFLYRGIWEILTASGRHVYVHGSCSGIRIDKSQLRTEMYP